MSDANYYTHFFCGGTFYVDLRIQSRGIAPCTYTFECDRCGERKSMPCLQEVRELNGSEFESRVPVKRVFTLR